MAAASAATAQKPIAAGSTRAAATSLIAQTPRLQYDTTVTDFAEWQHQMSDAMARLMNHPAAPAAPEELVSTERHDGYTLERWRSWPLKGQPVHYFVMIPDGIDGKAPAALCIPGFGQTKEYLAKGMGLDYVKEGIVAFLVDNPCFGELSDNGYSDYLASSRMLLEAGWSYLGLSSWQDKVVLDAMKRHPAVNPKRIIVSGFSLGTEPMMALGLLDPEIYAFVYNDFLCRTRERVLVMDLQQPDGSRPLPNTIEHLIPGFLREFDFPDIVAALAPRPVICTEGGLDRDFLLVADAFAKAGAADNFTYYHYPKYAQERALAPGDTMPAHIDRATFFRLANVDPPAHNFKAHLVLPWVRTILK